MMQVDLVLIIIFGAFYTIHIRGFFPLGGGHPQHGEAGYRSGEGARGGSPGGFPRVQCTYMRVGAVTGPLDATYRGPYRVMVRERKKLLLEVGAMWQWVSIDHLKPHTAAAAPAVGQPPPRGRPRKSQSSIKFISFVLS